MQLFQTNIFFNLLSVILGTHPWPLTVNTRATYENNNEGGYTFNMCRISFMTTRISTADGVVTIQNFPKIVANFILHVFCWKKYTLCLGCIALILRLRVTVCYKQHHDTACLELV